MSIERDLGDFSAGRRQRRKLLGFAVTTTDGTSTAVISAATMNALGFSRIRDVHMYVTGDDAYLGFGRAATTTAGEDIVIVFQNKFMDETDINYTSLNVIRSSTTNVTLRGYAVIE